ncbi:MAG: hypothetical protein LBQ86_08395, partial [Holophagales bacterium]|nr:hypothetical protein [Holophagales bacterium]
KDIFIYFLAHTLYLLCTISVPLSLFDGCLNLSLPERPAPIPKEIQDIAQNASNSLACHWQITQ